MTVADEYTLPDGYDCARWPFNHERARAAAALLAYPIPPIRTRNLRAERVSQVLLAQRRRRMQREQQGAG